MCSNATAERDTAFDAQERTLSKDRFSPNSELDLYLPVEIGAQQCDAADVIRMDEKISIVCKVRKMVASGCKS